MEVDSGEILLTGFDQGEGRQTTINWEHWSRPVMVLEASSSPLTLHSELLCFLYFSFYFGSPHKICFEEKDLLKKQKL